jgi:uncharacterized cupredoxin-like copper-binding protein
MQKLAYATILALGAALFLGANAFAVDLSAQKPIEVRMVLGKAGTKEHKYFPDKLSFETGKLYRLVLHNPSNDKHYFISDDFASKVWTRKIQVMDEVGPGAKTLSEIKGYVRAIEIYPGGTTEWWFVPVAAGTITDVHCTTKDQDGRTHAEHGMKGTFTIN